MFGYYRNDESNWRNSKSFCCTAIKPGQQEKSLWHGTSDWEKESKRGKFMITKCFHPRMHKFCLESSAPWPCLLSKIYIFCLPKDIVIWRGSSRESTNMNICSKVPSHLFPSLLFSYIEAPRPHKISVIMISREVLVSYKLQSKLKQS